MGNFPSASGARRVSSILTEDELLQSIQQNYPQVDVNEYLRYFVIDDSIILGLIDLPYTEGGRSRPWPSHWEGLGPVGKIG